MPEQADKILAAPFLKAPSFGSAVYNVASLKNFFKAKNGKRKKVFSILLLFFASSSIAFVFSLCYIIIR